MKRKALIVLSGAFLVISLGLKMKLDRPVNYDKLHSVFMAATARALERDGFSVLAGSDFRTVQAYKGACIVAIGVARPEGGSEAAFLADYGANGRLKFWYRGALLNSRPRAQGLLDRYWSRLSQTFAPDQAAHPMFHIIATPACEDRSLEALRLDDLS